MKKKLRTLFYGMTHEHAPGKLETLKRLSDQFEIVAIVDDRKVAGPWFQNEIVQYGDFPLIAPEKAFDIPDIDVAFVEVTNADLMSVAGRLAERGVPMHCDKPCGESMAAYRRVVEMCRAKNVPFQIGYMYRGNPALQFAWKFVREGLLGDVAFVEADMNHDYGSEGYGAYMGSFKGGILYSLGCHLVDMALPFVKGELKDAVTLLGDAPDDPPGSRTNGAAILRFEGADVLIRTCSHMPGGILCRRLRVDGTNGTLEIRPIERFDGGNLKLELTLKTGRCGYAAGTHVLDFGVLTDRYAAQLEDLAAIVRGDKPNDQDYDHDLRVHELTLRACGIAP